MKRLAFLAMVLVAMEMAVQPVWAIETSRTYENSMLVLLFLGICALIIVAQLVPALILIMGTVSDFAKRLAARKQVAVASLNQERTE